VIRQTYGKQKVKSYSTIAENFLMASAGGSPAMLGESVSKYIARDCRFASCLPFN